MNNIDYTKLRSIPKYDIGTRPIGSGYQRNADQVQLGYAEQQAATITNSFRDQAKQELIQTGAQTLLPFAKNVYGAASAYLSAAKSAAEPVNRATQGLSQIAEFGGAPEGFTSAGIKETGEAAAKQATSQAGKTAAQKALGSVNVAMNAYNALAGGYKTYLNWNDSDTLGGSDLLAGSAKGTQYVNGVSYSTMNGFDNKGFKDYVSAQNDAQKLGGVMSGVQAGMGAGGLIGMVGGPLGSLIGSGIGGVIGGIVGGIGGHHARDRRRRLYAEAVRNYANAAEAYNTQNASVAATQGMRNEYYATHADKGLPISKGEPNALVGARESLVGTDGNGNVTSVITMPEDQNHPYRLDNIPVKLDKGTGVAGNKIDPSTGLTIAEKVAPLAQLFNSTKNKHYKNHIGKLIKQEMELQDKLPDNNPNPYEQMPSEELYYADGGKTIDNMKTKKYQSYLPMFDGGWPPFFPTQPEDTGEPDVLMPKEYKNKQQGNPYKFSFPRLLDELKGAQYPTLAYLNNRFANEALLKEARKSKVHAYNPFAENRLAGWALSMLPSTYDIDPQKRALRNALGWGLNDINQSGSAGMRAARQSNLMNNYMRGIAGLISEKHNKENEMLANRAQLAYQIGEQGAQREQSGNSVYYDQLNKGRAAINNQINTILASMPKDYDRYMQNLSNLRYGNKYLSMVHQDVSKDKVDFINSLLNR